MPNTAEETKRLLKELERKQREIGSRHQQELLELQKKRSEIIRNCPHTDVEHWPEEYLRETGRRWDQCLICGQDVTGKEA